MRAEADDLQHLKQQNETNILLHAAEKGMDWTSLEGPLALALATAARATIIAEEQALERRILECQHLLTTLEDSRDEARGRICEATYQVGSLLNFFKTAGIPIEHDDATFQPSSLLLDHESDDDSSSAAPSEISCSASEDSTSNENFTDT